MSRVQEALNQQEASHKERMRSLKDTLMYESVNRLRVARDKLLRPGVSTNIKDSDLWLNDEIVNFALDKLGFAKPSTGAATTTSLAHAEALPLVLIHSQALSADLDAYEKHLKNSSFGEFMPTSVRAFVGRGLDGLIRMLDGENDMSRQNKVRLVAFPIHAKGHWSLLVMDCITMSFRHYDSLPGSHARYAEAVKRMLRAMNLYIGRDRDKSDWHIHAQRVEAQRDTWECGYSVIACAAEETGADIGLQGNLLHAAVSDEALCIISAQVEAWHEAGEKMLEYEQRLNNFITFKHNAARTKSGAFFGQ